MKPCHGSPTDNIKSASARGTAYINAAVKQVFSQHFHTHHFRPVFLKTRCCGQVSGLSFQNPNKLSDFADRTLKTWELGGVANSVGDCMIGGQGLPTIAGNYLNKPDACF